MRGGKEGKRETTAHGGAVRVARVSAKASSRARDEADW
jgi:hypothetical protein